MALPLLHRTRHDDRTDRTDRTDRADRPAASGSTAAGLGARVPVVQRVGAVAVALVVLVFGLLGFAGGLDYFSTSGRPIAGLSSNGLLSTISVVTAVVLIAAAFRGARTVSTVMIVIGVLFLVSALANLAVLDTGLNFLAFRFSNVVFSVVAGLVLLLLGAYGRVGGHLPADSPYARPEQGGDVVLPADEQPSTPAEFAAERAMRDAEVAVVQKVATADQRRRVAAMAQVRTRTDRRDVWMSFDRAPERLG
jgi:Domain of unknown function (DUF4383)